MNILDRTLLLLYIPIALLVYWKILKNPTVKKWFLLILSIAFYSFGGWQVMVFLVGLSLVTYALVQSRMTGDGVVPGVPIWPAQQDFIETMGQ